MSLKQVVKSHLKSVRQASPAILAEVDVLIQRSIIRLQNQDLLPPRTLEFTSKQRKQEKREDGDLVYNYYYLPEDFRKLDVFHPYDTKPYNWIGDEHELYQTKEYTESELKKAQRRFTITDTHHDDDSKYEKILIAFPFPDDDETVQIKYYVNGKNLDWDWLDETYWEVIITDVEKMIGLRSTQDPEAEQRISDAVSQHKEPQGHNTRNNTFRTLSGSYFGKRDRDLIIRGNDNNIY